MHLAMFRRSYCLRQPFRRCMIPDARRVEFSVNKVGRGNEFVILERADGWFAQVGYGEFAHVPAGMYALEYQEGSADRHFRCQTTDRTEMQRL